MRFLSTTAADQQDGHQNGCHPFHFQNTFQLTIAGLLGISFWRAGTRGLLEEFRYAELPLILRGDFSVTRGDEFESDFGQM